jgi:hypothetical protein
MALPRNHTTSRASSIYSHDSVDTLTPVNRSSRQTRPESVYSEATIDTLVAGPTERQGYRGFESREAYLAALRDWVDNQQYYESNVQLEGWYGTKTKQEYLDEPSIFELRRERKKAEKEAKDEQRRQTVSRLGPVAENSELNGDDAVARGGDAVGSTSKENKGSRLKRVFARRATLA